MIGKIIHSTKGKPCTCPAHKVCTKCTRKNVNPHVYVEDAHRLPFPIKITRHKENNAAIRYKEQKTITKKEPKRKEKVLKHKEGKKWGKPKIQAPLYTYNEGKPKSLKEKKVLSIYKQQPTLQYVENKRKTYEFDYLDTPRRKSRLSEWYKKRRATRELKNYYTRERKREKKEKLEREKAHRLKEEEVFQKLNYKPDSPKKKKKIFAKPQAESRYVSVKSYNHYDDITNKFVNCCYRLCCQFYCCLSCMIIIGFVIIFLI